MDGERHKFSHIFKCAKWHTDLKCISQWIREFDLKNLNDYKIINIKTRNKVSLYMVIGVFLTRVLALDLDVSSDHIQ
jgi:hypothetical protein